MELKFVTILLNEGDITSSNRTFMELKLMKPAWLLTWV